MTGDRQFITENDIVTILDDARRRGMDSDQLAYLQSKIRNGHGDYSLEVAEKIQQILMGTYKHERNIAVEVRQFATGVDGVFTLQDLYQALRMSDKHAQASARKCLQRLVEDGTLQKSGDKMGTYRPVDGDLVWIDPTRDVGQEIPLKWPLFLEDLIYVMPTNVLVIAGESNAGKTALLLRFCQMNKQTAGLPIIYFSNSEGEHELNRRLQAFGGDWPKSDWNQVRWATRDGNFADVIDPDAINIVDFLELLDNFWLIASMLKDISRKLRNGIAIVAIQKNVGTEKGLGGDRGLEKPRLYLALGHGWAKIMKGKNRRHDKVNPDRMECQWKLWGGCNFVLTSMWAKEGEKPPEHMAHRIAKKNDPDFPPET